MTSEEIKESVLMSDVLRERGISVRNGMCKCPFHDDKKPSMKVYKDGCRCFTCAESYDVFSFIQKYDGVSFKDAYISLGGTYARPSSRRERILTKARIEEARKANHSMVKRDLFRTIAKALMICDLCDSVYLPMSDEWCEIKNMEPIIKYYYDECLLSDGKEINELDVYRECRKFIQRFI